MRELERSSPPPSARALASASGVVIVGAGRLGTVLARSLRRAGVPVDGPLPRGAELQPHASDAVLLCVPDAAIAAAAADLPRAAFVGHCSGATGLEVLAPHEAFSLHPLMTVTADAAPDVLAGAGAAVDGTTPAALAVAEALAGRLGLRPVRIAAADRPAYHAAATIASNFLVTLEAAAERVAAGTGLPRELLVPLVRASVENWARLGPARALTGPVARGDAPTVARQRDAVRARAPELLALFDALVNATRELAGTETAVAC